MSSGDLRNKGEPGARVPLGRFPDLDLHTIRAVRRPLPSACCQGIGWTNGRTMGFRATLT